MRADVAVARNLRSQWRPQIKKIKSMEPCLSQKNKVFGALTKGVQSRSERRLQTQPQDAFGQTVILAARDFSPLTLARHGSVAFGFRSYQVGKILLD